LLICAFLVCFQANGKKMWGARRKDDEEVPVGFQESVRRASVMQDGGVDLSSLSLGDGVGSSDSIKPLRNFLEAYITMMEKLIDSPEFENMVTPDMFKNMMEKIPQMANFPGATELLESESFKDPVLLKETIREGAKNMRLYMSQIFETVNDPQKLQSLIRQLPTELQDVILKLVSGDVTAIKDMISSLPGITDAQKNMLVAMMDGDSSSMADTMQQMFSDPDQVEATRQQFLSDPSMAASLGIPEHVLRSKKKWAQFMRESMSAMDPEAMGEGGGRSLSGLSA